MTPTEQCLEILLGADHKLIQAARAASILGATLMVKKLNTYTLWRTITFGGESTVINNVTYLLLHFDAKVTLTYVSKGKGAIRVTR